MKNRSTGTVGNINELAEGGDAEVVYEPINPLATSTFPRLMSDISLNNRSETGSHRRVSVANEGEDRAIDQDAPDTSSDTVDKADK